MSNRITEKDLQEQCDLINIWTKSPMTPYDKTVANVGNYHLDFAYGGVQLVRMFNKGGGVTTPLGGGHSTKKELFQKLVAFLCGLLHGIENK